MHPPQKNKPDYGIDAPALARNVILLVITGSVAGYFLHRYSNEAARILTSVLSILVQLGLCAIVLSLIYVKVEKFRHRDKMLNMLSWTGKEQVLDVGTGRGLLVIGAAKRLTSGKSFGIDIWNKGDLSNNSYEAAVRNAELEGVKDKVEIKNADAQHLPFADNTFDYVLSNLCLHNIYSKEGRAAACREVIRVLKPGGSALISDFLHTKEYAETFTRHGLQATRCVSFLLAPFLLKIVKVQKM